MPRGQLAHLAENRQRCRDRVEGEERFECVQVDLAPRKRAQLGGEGKLTSLCAVVERLDAEAVTREHEPAAARIPDRDREHAAEALGESISVFFVEVQDHLRVTM